MPVKHFVLLFSCCKRSSRSPKESIICWAEKGCDTIGDYSQSRLCYVLDLCARLSAAHCDLQFRCRFYYRIARDHTSFHLTQMRVRIVKLRVRRLWVADDGNNLMTIVVLTEAHIFLRSSTNGMIIMRTDFETGNHLIDYLCLTMITFLTHFHSTSSAFVITFSVKL